MSYQPKLPLIDRSAAARIRERTELDWFHRIEIEGYVTPGFPYDVNWEFVARFLQDHASLLVGAGVLEPGCADGLWTCWLTQLGAKYIDATDIAQREQFRLIARAFGLPVDYYPGLLSTQLPSQVRRQYDLVCSLGLLYHVHDPLITLVMYRRYLKDSGILILETGAIYEEIPYLHYTGAGQIYGKEGGNQFIPTLGFLRSALHELGMMLEDQRFRSEGITDGTGKAVGRVILLARRSGPVGIHYYPAILEQLGMIGPPFGGDEWYGQIV
jgi:2-polyprenyl-3-methyl-5-hydroxy-6-metoxy-1,4-benzoquinol methylase